MKLRFLLLQAIAHTPLQLAKVRNLLSKDQLNLVHIEIADCFIVSCNRTDARNLAKGLENDEQDFLLIYVNHKTGCNVISRGLNEGDKNKIEQIIKDFS